MTFRDDGEVGAIAIVEFNLGKFFPRLSDGTRPGRHQPSNRKSAGGQAPTTRKAEARPKLVAIAVMEFRLCIAMEQFGSLRRRCLQDKASGDYFD